MEIHLYWIHVRTDIRRRGRASSGSICIGSTYKQESVREDDPPQDPFVLDPRTNQNPSERTIHLSNRLYWICVQTDIRRRGRATLGSICIGSTYIPESVREVFTSGAICMGFTYKPKYPSEGEPPQAHIVLEPRTNQNSSANLRMHMLSNDFNGLYWIHLQTRARK